MSKKNVLTIVAVAMAVFAGPAQAGTLSGELGILTPDTLAGNNPATGAPWEVGDNYRFAFFTSVRTTAESNDISTYNTWVQDLANATTVYDIGADEGVTWKAIGSTDAVDARDNTSTNPTVETGHAIFLLDGSTVVANDYADLWDGEIQHIIDINEQGTVDTWWPWTGTYLDGTKAPGHGASFSALGGGGNIHQGRSDIVTEWIWRTWTGDPPDYQHNMYALSDPLVIVGPANAASNPNPANRATDVCGTPTLTWTPGAFVGALSPRHKVFLSESFDDVNDGVGGVTQDTNRYPPTGTLSLDFSKTYYWKVDEANSTTGWDEGDIWQFTTEPIAYPIAGDNITATASSSKAADEGPENTINGSGLDANDLHSMETTDMWLSSEEESPGQAWIEYEFDKVYKLHEMWVWNHNSSFEGDLGYGLKDVTIEYSENGMDYTTLGTTHEFAQAPGAPGYEHNTEVYFGVPAKYVKLTANSNWGGFHCKYGLSEVRFFRIPVCAREESPESGTTIDGIDVVLSWIPGREADEHNVYFSASFEDVNTGTIAPDIIDAAGECETSYGPLSLELGKTYYWKVNEVNLAETHTTWQGDVWNFTTPEYLVVDDMEAYTGRQSIRAVWHDGYVAGIAPSGSNVTVSTESDDRDPRLAGVGPPWPVRGSEAMQFAYDNDGSITLYVQPYAITSYGANANYYSEIAASTSGPNSLEVGWDWTSAKALSLWFYGEPNNAAEQMYVKLNGSKVIYDGDAGDIQQAEWQQWNIALSDFGVNLQNVTMVYIGFGDENNTTPGGSGVVFFDDIRLYPTRCVLSKRSDDFARVDYVEDCVVDYKEVAAMAENWLVEAAAPGNANLYEDQKIDFKDFAELAVWWLDEQLWP